MALTTATVMRTWLRKKVIKPSWRLRLHSSASLLSWWLSHCRVLKKRSNISRFKVVLRTCRSCCAPKSRESWALLMAYRLRVFRAAESKITAICIRYTLDLPNRRWRCHSSAKTLLEVGVTQPTQPCLRIKAAQNAWKSFRLAGLSPQASRSSQTKPLRTTNPSIAKRQGQFRASSTSEEICTNL